MVEIVIRVVFNALAAVAAVRIVPGAEFQGDWLQIAMVAAIFGVVNAYLRPIVKLLSLPLRLLTFGLIGFVINTGLVMLVAAISDNLSLGFTLSGWPPGPIDVDVLLTAFLVSIVISLVSAGIAFVRFSVPRA